MSEPEVIEYVRVWAVRSDYSREPETFPEFPTLDEALAEVRRRMSNGYMTARITRTEHPRADYETRAAEPQ